MRRTKLDLALALVLPLAGCSLIIDNPTQQVVNRCASDVDCSGGAHCDATMAMCVQPPTLPYDLWLEVVPPAGAPIDLGPYMSFAGPVALPVPRPVTVRGTVHQDGASDVPVSAQLTFAPVEATTTAVPTHATRTATSGSSDFSTSLPGRGDYDVLVEPLAEFRATIPPFRSRLSVSAMETALQVVLPAPSAPLEGTLVDPSATGLSDFEVLAVDRASGAQLSSVATTTTDGAFAIHFAPGADAFDLIVRPTAARQGRGLVPTYRVRPEVLLPDAMGRVTILVPASLPSVHWAGTVETPEARGAAPVGLAVVQLHSEDVVDSATGVVGTLDLSMTTDADGVYDGMVLPGTYSVTITASSDDTLGVLREVRDLHPAAGVSEILGHVFHLPLRTVLAGTVQSPDGDLVRDAQVRATPLGIPLVGLTDPEVARFARPAMALSGPMGDFRLDLDVGVYDVVVEPPEGSGFPWTVVLDYGIGGSTQTLADVMQVDAPVVVDGVVTWQDGGVLAGAEVRAFAITSDGRPVMVGRATSDADGEARILVPAMIGSHDPTMMARLRP